MTRKRSDSAADDARVFGAYVRMLRENFHASGRGKSLRQVARETGIAPSVLSRGERGLQDLRRGEYLERLGPHLGVRSSVMKRIASLITRRDLEAWRQGQAAGAGARTNGPRRLLWTRLARELQRLRDASPETLDAVLTYVEYLGGRDRRGKVH